MLQMGLPTVGKYLLKRIYIQFFACSSQNSASWRVDLKKFVMKRGANNAKNKSYNIDRHEVTQIAFYSNTKIDGCNHTYQRQKILGFGIAAILLLLGFSSIKLFLQAST